MGAESGGFCRRFLLPRTHAKTKGLIQKPRLREEMATKVGCKGSLIPGRQSFGYPASVN
jgi:hypothetical protein